MDVTANLSLARSMATASREMDPRMVVTDMSPGNPQLRRQIALRYMVGGLMLPMEELLITNGAVAGCLATCR